MPIRERPAANTVDGSEVEGTVRAEDTGLWRRLTCNSWTVGSSRVRAGDTDLGGSLTCNSSQDDATVKCWGYNANGELGQGDDDVRGDKRNGGCVFLKNFEVYLFWHFG